MHFLALVVRQIADQLRKNLHEGRDRKHQNLFHRLQVIVHQPPDCALILFRCLGTGADRLKPLTRVGHISSERNTRHRNLVARAVIAFSISAGSIL